MRISKALVAFLFFQFFTPFASASEVPPTFSFHGSGYGHGVGLSQIGARAMALAGESPTSILKYYYTGVDIVPLPDTQTIRVNIAHLQNNVKISTTTPGANISVSTNESTTIAQVATKSVLSFSKLGSQIVLMATYGKKVVANAQSRNFIIQWSGNSPIVSVTTSMGTLRYKYGQMQIKSVRTKDGQYFIEVTNSLRIHDEYLYGIGEVPSSWPMNALQAQVIASRTYALSKLGLIKTACDCNLYASNTDQSFIGYAKEGEPKYGAIWRQAVDATHVDEGSGFAITLAGLPITPYFTSSTGGQTESALNAWGSERSYTLSVADTSSTDVKLNPHYATWDRSVSQEVIAAAFLLPDVVKLEILSKNSTGTVAQIKATSSAGIEVILRGETFRSRAKIPSAWFDLVSV